METSPTSPIYVAPSTSAQLRVVTAFEEVLGLERVGIHDDFFVLGGDSIGALKVQTLLERTSAHPLPVTAVFLNPTGFLLGPLLERMENGSEEASNPLIETSADPGDGLTSQQHHFWILDAFSENRAAFNSVLGVAVDDYIDPARVRRTLDHMVAALPIFQTRYAVRNGTLEVFLDPTGRAEFEVIEMVDEEPFTRSGAAALNMAQIRRLPFDLEQDVPMRVRLYRLGSQRHYLAFCFHHIVTDGTSHNTFWRLFGECYAALRTDQSLPHPDFESTYAAFAQRQARRKHTDRSAADLSYWCERLREMPPPLDFRCDYPNGDGPFGGIAEVNVPMSQEIHTAANEFARCGGTTPHVVFLAAYYVTLARFFDAREMVVGVPFSGRNLAEDQSVVGCCINMFSLRMKVDLDLGFRHLVEAVRRCSLEALEHSDVHFLDIVRALEPGGQSSNQIFNTSFQYRNFPVPLEPLDGTLVEYVCPEETDTQFPLLLEVHPYHGQARFCACFDTRLFAPERVERLLRDYRNLLQAALREPDCPLGVLDRFDPGERETILTDWSCHESDYPRSISVVDRFREMARCHRSRVALVFGECRLTYTELDARSDRIAVGLIERGVRPGDRVGVGLERSFDLIIALLAVIKTGAAYCPIDPEYPAERVKFMVQDAELTCVVIDRSGYSRLLNLGLEPILIEDLDRPVPPVFQWPVPVASDPLYLMYTSGSSGQPKGSLIPHRGMLRLVCGSGMLGTGPDEVFLHLASSSFDAASFEIWGPLLNGARVVLMSPGPPSLRDLEEAILQHAVTTLLLPVGLFNAMVEEHPTAFRPLRTLLVGGDVVSPSHAQRVLSTCPGLVFVNAYGPTENSVISCCHRVTKAGEIDLRRSLPIGRPIENSEVYILDATLQPVPFGVIGELFLGGDGLSLGYWRRPTLNTECFIVHPFANDPNKRLYRSGDLARFLPNGSIEFHGRRDQQVKIRGFRVELTEVESLLGKCPLICHCIVDTFKSAMGDSLIAWYVPSKSNHLNQDELLRALRRHAHEHLPSYMVPALWVALEAVPLTPNGKIDRRNLPIPTETHREPDFKDIAGNSTEAILLEIWRRLFQSDSVGCCDDFFDLGGHSLLAIRFVAEAERKLDHPVSLQQLFQHRTVRALARALDDVTASEAPAHRSIVSLASGGTGSPLFIVHGWGGDVFVFVEFATALSKRLARPVLGLQASVEPPGIMRPTTVEALASRYVQEMRDTRPEGPYFLCGYSLGGLIAFEMARQLEREGAAIGQLFVIDSLPLGLPWWIHGRMLAPYLCHRLRDHYRNWKDSGDSSLRAFVRGRADALRQWLGFGHDRLLSEGDEDFRERPFEVDHFQTMTRRYRPVPARIPVTLIRAYDNHLNLSVGWRYLTRGEVKTTRIEGSHLEMFRGLTVEPLVDVFEGRFKEIAKSRLR